MPNLVFIFGPPAAGKAAIGHELAGLTGYRFFHNHLTADPVAALFGFGTDRFGVLVDEIRDRLFQEAARDVSIPGVIFTFVWAMNLPRDRDFVERTVRTFAEAGGQTCFVELLAPLQARIDREGTPFRVGLKPALRDVAAARARQVDIDSRFRMNTVPNELQPWPHLQVDTEAMLPHEAARFILRKFAIPEAGA